MFCACSATARLAFAALTGTPFRGGFEHGSWHGRRCSTLGDGEGLILLFVDCA
jgi:hypothetical protein